jgi:putative DNA methylase
MRKKMIEVAIPLDAINKESAREKTIRHGHPSTLHLWWARRPLAACRAVLFASFVDDPESDPANRNTDGTVNAEQVSQRRRHLFELLTNLVQWDNSCDLALINQARAEIAASYASEKVHDSRDWTVDTLICGEKVGRYLTRTAAADAVDALLAQYLPPVLDPFCGGGSIPLEAQRLGLRARASDLNPVPVLINKALIELPQQFAGLPPVNPDAGGAPTSERKKGKQKTFTAKQWHGAEGLAADVRFYGKWMRDEAEKQIGHLYPKVKVTEQLVRTRPELNICLGQELTVVAWLWARAIQCPNPVCRARTPLVRSFWLSKKKGKQCYALPHIDHERRIVRFTVEHEGEPPQHTTDRNGAVCLFCGTVVKKPQLRALAVEHGITTIPLAIAVDGNKGRIYLNSDAVSSTPCVAPEAAFLNEPITNDRRWFSPPLYGLTRFKDLFTPRQLEALTAFSDLIAQARESVLQHAESAGEQFSDPQTRKAYADAVATYLAFAQSKACNRNTTLCLWENNMDRMVATFGRQALPMVWDFAETNPLAGAGGDLYGTVESVCEVLDRFVAAPKGSVVQCDATQIEAGGSPLISTDPPYYDNIGYADLSDFFYLWLRRSLSSVYPHLFPTVLTPKQPELIAVAYRHDGSKEAAKRFFENGLRQAFTRMRDTGNPQYPLTIFYAFKQSETEEDEEEDSATMSTGWETMLEGVIGAGFVIDGTWPMRTEQPKGLRAFNVNALASSIVLVCRQRQPTAPQATRRQFIAELRQELPNALRNLQAGNIAPVDLAQAAIGPGMAVFTRYSRVVEGNGTAMSVRTALGLINQSLDEVLAEQEGDYDADTRWSLKWFEQFAHDDGPFGDANTLATAMSIGINGLVETGIVQAKAGKVRLLKRTELMNGRPETWDPATDRDIVHWEVCQYLIHALDTKGEAGAAALLRRINARYPGASETARELAYRLYTICERKKWAQEAMAYNSLIVAWPEIVKLAQSSDGSGSEAQTTMF